MRRRPLICRKCGSADIPARHIAKSDYRCRPCLNADASSYRSTLVAAGKAPSRMGNRRRNRVSDAQSFQRAYADPAKRERHIARSRARHAIKAGKLVRQPCEICSSVPVEAHHDDYSQPLNVRWLCPSHHRAHHAAERDAARIQGS